MHGPASPQQPGLAHVYQPLSHVYYGLLVARQVAPAGLAPCAPLIGGEVKPLSPQEDWTIHINLPL